MTERTATARRRARGTAAPEAAYRPWYSVVALPPFEIGQRFRQLQRSIGVAEAEPIPHLSLKMPFHVRTRLADVKRRIGEIAAATQPVVVSINGIGSFAGPYSNAIYAAVEPNECLQTLHTALVRGLEGATDPVYPYTEEIELASYVPHLTLASDLSEPELAELLRRLRGVALSDGFRMTELDLWRRDARGRWRLVQSFGLRGRSLAGLKPARARRPRPTAVFGSARRSTVRAS